MPSYTFAIYTFTRYKDVWKSLVKSWLKNAVRRGRGKEKIKNEVDGISREASSHHISERKDLQVQISRLLGEPGSGDHDPKGRKKKKTFFSGTGKKKENS